MKKRLALSFLSLELARLPVTSDALHACLVGGWTSCLMYRRPFMSILAKSYTLCSSEDLSQDDPKIIALPRAVAEELSLLAVLAPIITTDLSSKFDPDLYASDASEAKGAYVFKRIGEEASRALWRNGRRKGGYVRMLNREEALIRKIDEMKEEHLFPLGQSRAEHSYVTPDRPRAQKFHFIEVCGGAGKVSKAMSARGWNVGPNLDLDGSPYFDLRNLKVISWLIHLLENELLDSFMVQPLCTTFSPAQYPPSRTYQQPRGLDPTDPKTKEGTELALRALLLILIAANMSVPSILEQPRRSKMRRLAEWLFLISTGLAAETWLASCQYGSPHQKEFVMLCTFPEAEELHRKCSRDHEHVKIEGQYTKNSAIYTDQLAEALAGVFDKALSRKHRLRTMRDVKSSGLESVVVNDFLLTGGWFTKRAWRWKKPAHINILESAAVGRLFKDFALLRPKSRFSVILDSNVSLSAHVKGRSPSYGLRPCLRRSGATIIAGCLYPAYHFGPTRLNVADAPTRDCPLPDACDSVLPVGCGFDSLLDFCSLSSLNRAGANWIRLTLLVAKLDLKWKSLSESWRYSHVKFGRWPFVAGASRSSLDFDQTLGFPGEGPFDWISRDLCPSRAIVVSLCLVAVGLLCVRVDFGVGFSRRLLTTQVACSRCVLLGLVIVLSLLCVGLSRRPSISVVACSQFAFLIALAVSLFWVGLSRRPSISVVACSLGIVSVCSVSALSGVGISRRPLNSVVACLSFVSYSLSSSVLKAAFSAHCPLSKAPPCRTQESPSRGFISQGKSTRKSNLGFALWLLLAVDPTNFCHGAPVPASLKPRDSGDMRRLRTRDVQEELPVGRPVLKQTEVYREKLLKTFDEWLVQEGISVDQLLGVVNPDIDAVNTLLEKYGRQLFKAGRPYGHYAETINAVASRRPRIRRSLQQAWDLAFAWLRREPPIHHVALPWQALLSILATSLAWGWVREAGVIALSWGGITRIGEVLAATRANLVLPCDMGGTEQFALLEIQEPKTRFSTARHQAARLDHPQLLQVIEMSFRDLLPGELLWPASSQTMRNRFQKLLKANNLDNLPEGVSRGLDLGSLRAGGASWLLLTSEDSELTRRRGRWIISKVMEIYVQEVAALQFLPKLPRTVRDLIFQGASLFTLFLSKALKLHAAGVPPRAWNLLFKNEAAFHGNVAERSGLEKLGGLAKQVATTKQPCDRSLQQGEKKKCVRTELLHTNNDGHVQISSFTRPRPPGPVLEHWVD